MYQKLYTELFNAVTDSIEALTQGRVAEAKAILIAAQQTCEELYLAQEEKEE